MGMYDMISTVTCAPLHSGVAYSDNCMDAYLAMGLFLFLYKLMKSHGMAVGVGEAGEASAGPKL